MANLVEIRGLTVEAKTDSGRTVEIIRGIDLDVADGEIVALIGESGSGKTTIALTLMGYARPGCRISGGAVSVGGTDMAAICERARARMRGRDVAYIPQSAAAAFNPARTVMDQVVEVARIHDLMPDAQARRKAVDLFRALALPNPETIGARYPHEVSGGQLQRLAAAMALIGDPRLVIFDEPTTALDVTTQIEVLRVFKSVMKAKGMAGVYVSHDLAVVAQIADRIVVLRDGMVQESGTTTGIIEAPAHAYTRELLAAFEHAPRTERAVEPLGDQTDILDVRNLSAGFGPIQPNGQPRIVALRSVNMTIARGTNFGIVGESGCGKSTLARVIAGIIPPFAGSVVMNGRPLGRDLAARSREDMRRLQIVFQLADTALNPAKSIGDILGRPLAFYHGLRGRAREARLDELLDMVRLPRALKHRLPAELSGGQKQRVNLARALAAEPDLIICDEITSALDTVVAAAIMELLKQLQRDLGLSYIFISHDLSMVRSICDRIAVMYAGEKIEELGPDAFGAREGHPYSRLLHQSTPRLDPTWLDRLHLDPEAASFLGKTKS
ncbi:ABC transporter ATP-binding protein [Aureimonas pseudogalii]|uniref:Peptide/nickel transport system ATP-binding protein n=1 Tax=Aureimonas pseudogalii TaxID=1744844 RepID=A0A7W6H480_9HYPH|nr:ABC transporter ATP-binding protein [Aureimonas pseudogalii]MBB3996724.1 peptide/nickel transport system ATP-binding protein [Aureimonas pseudogalii]